MNYLHSGYFFMLLWLSAYFFVQNQLFQKIFLRTQTECQAADRLSLSHDLGPNCLQSLSAGDKSRC